MDGFAVRRLLDAQQVVDLVQHVSSEGQRAREGAAAKLSVPILKKVWIRLNVGQS